MRKWLRRHRRGQDPDFAREKAAVEERAEQAREDLIEQRVRFGIEQAAFVVPLRRLRPEVVKRNHLNDMAVEALLGKKPRTTT